MKTLRVKPKLYQARCPQYKDMEEKYVKRAIKKYDDNKTFQEVNVA